MIEVLLGFFIGVAATYLAITEHHGRGEADDFRAMLHELKKERTRVSVE